MSTRPTTRSLVIPVEGAYPSTILSPRRRGLMASMALFALWRPRVVYDNVHHEDPDRLRPRVELKRLAKHWPIYPALTIWLLWNFAPGARRRCNIICRTIFTRRIAPMGRMERHLRRLLHPDLHPLWSRLPAFRSRKLLFWGTACRRAAIRAAAVHPLGDRAR